MTGAHIDVVLVGGGIMSATLGTLLSLVEPSWTIRLLESSPTIGGESSDTWSNAGTGHAGLCEVGYMDQRPNGSLSPTRAIRVNREFLASRELWAALCEAGYLADPREFIHSTPHMTFVHGDEPARFLRRRFEALQGDPHFVGLEHTQNPQIIAEWAPLLVEGRSLKEPLAATYSPHGTDIDFGALTRLLVKGLQRRGASVRCSERVLSVARRASGQGWIVRSRDDLGRISRLEAAFVFVGAGGGSLRLLQNAEIPAIRGYGAFPLSGKFLVCKNDDLIAAHRAKVYGRVAPGDPPRSVPHLDRRTVGGKAALLFGPFAGFTPAFLKSGSWWDLPRSVRSHNVVPLLSAARDNAHLLRYLASQVMASPKSRERALSNFVPTASLDDWSLMTAGKRVQIIKPDPVRGGRLDFGTELVFAPDGSLASLLGASPGASTAAAIMLRVIQRCFPHYWRSWAPTLASLMPSSASGEERPPLARQVERALERTSSTLGLTDTNGE